MPAMSRRPTAAVAALTLAACGHPAPPPPIPTATVASDPTGPHADAIAAQVKPYVDAEILSGVVVGVIDGDHTEIYGFGARTPGKPDRPDGRTVFELGTFTQVFTSLLLADSVLRGEVGYDTELAQLMPLGVSVPTESDQRITLEMLATHRSGLPAMPRSLAPKVFDPDPYSGYTADRMYDDLVSAKLEATPGTLVHYSSWGVGLLGFALARKAGTDYPTMFSERVGGPLHLADTHVDVTAEEQARVAPGHNEDLGDASPWHLDAVVGAGGLHSTARDLLALLRAEIDAAHGGQGPLADRLRATQEVRVPADPRSVALGWWVEKDGRLWHTGTSGGYHAFVGFDPARRQGVVLLAATSTSLVDRLGGALLDVLAGSAPPPVEFPDPSTFAALVGRYQVGNATADVVARGKRLYLIEEHQPPTRLLPLSTTEFFLEPVQAPMAFDVEDGKAVALVVFVGGQRIEGRRTGDVPGGTGPAPGPSGP
jgi:CubicO group peptidase (beta-lactamase class C family)